MVRIGQIIRGKLANSVFNPVSSITRNFVDTDPGDFKLPPLPEIRTKIDDNDDPSQMIEAFGEALFIMCFSALGISSAIISRNKKAQQENLRQKHFIISA